MGWGFVECFQIESLFISCWMLCIEKGIIAFTNFPMTILFPKLTTFSDNWLMASVGNFYSKLFIFTFQKAQYLYGLEGGKPLFLSSTDLEIITA